MNAIRKNIESTSDNDSIMIELQIWSIILEKHSPPNEAQEIT